MAHNQHLQNFFPSPLMLALNPEFITWHSQDQMILSALITSLSETILVYVVKCATSRNVCTTLERMFTAQSRARSMSIHYQLATLCKGDSSIADYFHCFTHLIDTFIAIDQPLPYHESLSFLLTGLGSDYDSLVTFVHTQLNPIALEDIYGHLLSHELRLSQINLWLISQLPLPILSTKAPPLVVAVVVEIPIPPLLFVDAVASIIREDGGVVDLTSPLLPIALFAKCVTNQGMWRCNVITGLITHINLIILIR